MPVSLGGLGIAKNMKTMATGTCIPRPRGIRVAVSGTFSYTNEDGSTYTDIAVTAGELLRFPPKSIEAITTAVLQGYYD